MLTAPETLGTVGVDTDHMLLSVLDVEGTAGQVLRGLFIDLVDLRAAVSPAENQLGPAEWARQPFEGSSLRLAV